MSSVFILAGEPSGDLHASHLIRALNSVRPGLQIFGVAGPRMVAEGAEAVVGMEQFAIMGFSDVLKSLPRIRKQLSFLKETILKRQPPLVVLVDYAGLNMRLARQLREAGYRGKIAHYISPKVWAWGGHRIRALAETLDLLVTIFPFEPSYFAKTSLKVEYVGNPLWEEVANHQYTEDWRKKCGISDSLRIVGLFPGSRPGEIRLNGRRHLEAAERLHRRYKDLHFALSVASDGLKPLLLQQLSGCSKEFVSRLTLVPREETYDLMRHSTTAIATSGTVNLELALHSVPHVVVYRVSHTNAFIARCIFGVRLPHYSIANFVHGETFLPELIYLNFTARQAARTVSELLEEGPARHACIAGCDRVRSLLQSENPSEKAARLLLPLLES